MRELSQRSLGVHFAKGTGRAASKGLPSRAREALNVTGRGMVGYASDLIGDSSGALESRMRTNQIGKQVGSRMRSAESARGWLKGAEGEASGQEARARRAEAKAAPRTLVQKALKKPSSKANAESAKTARAKASDAARTVSDLKGRIASDEAAARTGISQARGVKASQKEGQGVQARIRDAKGKRRLP
jgi:hypothetical protein